MFDIYQQQILERYKHPQHAGSVDGHAYGAEGSNHVCGDEIRWELNIDKQGMISDLKHVTRACAVCTASADLLADELLGKSKERISEANAKTIEEMLGIPLSPARLKCALLPLETLKEALKEA
jgi:nitrogen fixation NifU-like protein